jgi:hypothetical protein
MTLVCVSAHSSTKGFLGLPLDCSVLESCGYDYLFSLSHYLNVIFLNQSCIQSMIFFLLLNLV